MKLFLLAVLLSVAQGISASVKEMNDGHAESVIEVYEEMREEQQDTENGWIHDFEKDSVGTEMDHLRGLKRNKINEKKI